MVYRTQNYCVFGFFPSSGILGTTKHDVSETGYVFVFRFGGRHLLRTETDPASETLCFLVFRIPDDGKSLKTQ
jgi:hypothetical protein